MPQSENSLFDENLSGIANLHRFRHDAMAAAFEIFIVHRDAVYAEQAACAAFDELSAIENNLSRFIENSDVSRINSLGIHRPLQIGPAAFDCIRTGIEMYKQTNGAFDITVGSSQNKCSSLKLNESEHTVELLAEDVQLDLGAIGKGYAADKMAQLLNDWDIDTALISAGQSTILPVGKPIDMPGWPITISNPAHNYQLLAKIHLSNKALSASGIKKGLHIINPRSGEPATNMLAAWALSETASTGRLTAASADALSTAFMVMTIDEVRVFCDSDTAVAALLLVPGDKNTNTKILRFGDWSRADFYCE